MDVSQYLEIFLDETNEHLQSLNTIRAIECAAVAETLFRECLELLYQHLPMADNLCKPLNWRPISGA